MNKLNLKRILPLVVLILFLTPITTSSLLDLEQKRENKIILEIERVQREIERKKEQKIYLMGKFDPAEKEDFILIPPFYIAKGATQNKMYLRKEVFEAYLLMQNAANEDEVDLKIASATRNFDYQKELWNKKWTGTTLVDGEDLSESISNGLKRFAKILEYSAVPGTSRHHWGTEIDINGAIPWYFDTKKGKREYKWLITNAPLFGFCQTYNKKGAERALGHNEEKWHWSYLPLARVFTEEYKVLIKGGDMGGFLGDEYIANFNLINDYVLAINPDCL